MLLLTIAGLSLLALINYRIARAPFYPATVFCGAWAAALLFLWLSGDSFYPLTQEALLIFFCGGFALSIGCALVFLKPQAASTPRKAVPLSEASNRIVNLLVAALLLGLPFAYLWIRNQAAQRNANFFGAISFALLDPNTEETFGYKFFGNLVLIGLMAALITFRERESGKRRALVALVFGLAVNLLTAGRVGTATLIAGVLWLDWIKTRRVNWKFLIVVGMVGLVVFAGLAITLGKGDARPDAALAENAAPVARGFVLYYSGAVVAFDRVVREPGIVPHIWQVDRFPRQMLNKVGANLEVPWIHANFVSVGPNSLYQNVYSIYFTFYDWGFAGMMVLVAFTGVISAFYYRRALQGDRVSQVFYGFFFYALALSPYYDGIYVFLYSLIKCYAILWLVYKSPLAWEALKKTWGKSAAAEVVAYRSQVAKPELS